MFFINGETKYSRHIEQQQEVSKQDKKVLYRTGDIPKDSFEKSNAEMNNRRKNESENLNFTKVRIQFYPEDEEKMKSMELEERIAYKKLLKAQNRYISLDDSSDIVTKKHD